MGTEEAWEYLMDSCDVGEETLSIITSINGYSLNTLEDVLFAVSGYRSFEDAYAYAEDDEDDETLD